MKPLPPRPARDTIPPSIKRHVTERDAKQSSDVMAIAIAFTQFTVASNRQHDQHVAQLSAIHAHQIEMHAWLVSTMRRRAIVTFLGAALGAFAAFAWKGLP